MNDGKVQKHLVEGKIYISQRDLSSYLFGSAQTTNEKTGSSIIYSTSNDISERANEPVLRKPHLQNGHYGEVVDALQKQLVREQALNDRLSSQVDDLQEKLTEAYGKLAGAYEKVFQLDTILKAFPKMLTESSEEEKIPEEPAKEAEIPSPPLPPEPEPYAPRHQDEKYFGQTFEPQPKKKRSISPFGVRDRVAGMMGWD